MDIFKVCQLFCFLLVTLQSVEGLRCRSCNLAHSLDDCTTSVTCSRDESCYVDEIITEQLTIIYNGGCRAKDICSSDSSSVSIGKRILAKRDELVACSRCCSQDFSGLECNAKLCGIKQLTTASSLCYVCDSNLDGAEQGDVDLPSKCQSLSTCPTDRSCGSRLYTLGAKQTHKFTCLPTQTCTLLTKLSLKEMKKCKDPATADPALCGDRRRSTGQEICSACCGDALCNSGSCFDVLDRLYNLWTFGVLNFDTLTTNGTLPATTVKTTKLTTQNTTHSQTTQTRTPASTTQTTTPAPTTQTTTPAPTTQSTTPAPTTQTTTPAPTTQTTTPVSTTQTTTPAPTTQTSTPAPTTQTTTPAPTTQTTTTAHTTQTTTTNRTTSVLTSTTTHVSTTAALVPIKKTTTPIPTTKFRSIRCRVCNHALSLDDCTQSVLCSNNESCYMDEVVTEQFTIVYNGGCRAKAICQFSHSHGVVGKRELRKKVPNIQMCASRLFTNEEHQTYIYTCLSKKLCTILTMTALREMQTCKDPSTFDPAFCANNKKRSRGQQICTACCGDALCNSGSCFDILDRLYNLWTKGVLDFDTLTTNGTSHGSTL